MHSIPLLLLLLAAEPQTLTGRVVSITDGDSITVLSNGAQVKIRLVGVDAPERKQPFGTRAREHLASLVHEKDVTIETSGQDRYGRTLGVVYVGGKNVNAAMVESGMAWHYVQYSKDKRLMIVEHDAREFKRGLWADPEPVPPWEWRRRKNP